MHGTSMSMFIEKSLSQTQRRVDMYSTPPPPQKKTTTKKQKKHHLQTVSKT